MIIREEVYKIGSLGKPHGIHGELQMQFSDDVFDRTEAPYLILDLDGILVPFFIEEYRFRNDSTLLIKFLDIDTKDAARQLTGAEVFFPRNMAREDTHAPSWASLIGYSLLDARTSETVGTVTAVDTTTTNYLFEVDTPDGTQILIPANEHLIKDINPHTRTIAVDIPDGLLSI